MLQFDQLFDNFYPWLAGQYSSREGGFYYARSSWEKEYFAPDIESTTMALDILDRSGLIADMPETMKNQLILFFKSRQNEVGYFLDPHNEMNKVDRMVARAVQFGLRSLQILGTEPQYDPPGKNDHNLLPIHLHSLTNFEKWLNQRPWEEDAWMAGDNISATMGYFTYMDSEIREKMLEFLWTYLEQKQNPETGVWGEGRPYIRLSGAFKLAIFYYRFNKPMPRGEKIFEFLKDCIKTDSSEDMCWTRNVMDLVRVLRPQLPEIPQKEKEEIVDITYTNLTRYLKPDGGFSRRRALSLKTPNNVRLGLGLEEGDMNAGTQALRIRSLCLNLLDCPDTPLEELTRDFYKRVRI